MTGNWMMTFSKQIQLNKGVIVQRWLDEILATYGKEASLAFGRQKNQFANPVGHTLREGIRVLFDALLYDPTGDDLERVRQHLHDIIKIRAVQQFTPSQAINFIFQLKQIVRDEMGTKITDPLFLRELAVLEDRIDRLAQDAFDIFVQCREQLLELRVNELKRQIPWFADRMNGQDQAESESIPVEVSCEGQAV